MIQKPVSPESASKFQNLPEAAPDPAFFLVGAYAQDPATQKANLCPGFYRDANSAPWVLPCVAKAKEIISRDKTANHEHLPLAGHPDLCAGSRRLVFGQDNGSMNRVATIQTVSGTGANHLAAKFLSLSLKPRTVWISNPSWILHGDIWASVDETIERRFYPYYDPQSQSVDFDDMIATLREEAQPDDVVILHGCAHNPTGLDLSHDQWTEVAGLCREKNLFPLFDIAYQGFATGNLDDDVWAVRHFFQRGTFDFAVAQSFSKNFGLYGERIGALHIATADESGEVSSRVSTQLVRIQRSEITSAPSYGARIVATVLGNPTLYKQWLADLETMSQRMRHMRKRLHEELLQHNAPGSWDHILSEIGMFTMSGLTKEQVAALVRDYHIYLLPSGRISVTGLTEDNVAYVAQSISAVLLQAASRCDDDATQQVGI